MTTSAQIAPVKIGMMSKFWLPGVVKTRLARDTGDETAARVHKHFTLYLCHRLSAIAGFRYVFTAPDGRCEDMQSAIGGDWIAVPQGTGDLGKRMARALQFLLMQGDSTQRPRAILIGADLPTLNPSDLNAALDELQDADLVLGPAVDGGYYLIGFGGPWRDTYHRLFESIPWSTEQVFAQTMQVATELNLHCRLLRQREDVDDLPSLHRLLQSDSTDEDLRMSIHKLLPSRPVTCK